MVLEQKSNITRTIIRSRTLASVWKIRDRLPRDDCFIHMREAKLTRAHPRHWIRNGMKAIASGYLKQTGWSRRNSHNHMCL